MQVAYVVEDIDAAVEHWAKTLQVGPFFVRRHVAYKEVTYRGAPSAADVSLAFAYSGDLNIELVQQHNEAPSVFRDFIGRHGYGVQHVGVISDDIEADARFLADKGVETLQRLVNANGVETRFFDTELFPGAMLELIQRSPTLEAGFAHMKAAAETWDGMQALAS
jgi:hypothetical protein